MSRKPLPTDELSAYYVAGQAVMAGQFGIKVCRLSIKPDRPGQARTRLAALRETCNLTTPHTLRTTEQIERYVATLLAGSAGQLIRIERNMGYRSRCTGQVKLEQSYLAKISRCTDPQVELAFVLAIGWLSRVDGGNAEATLVRLWKRANQLLRTEENRQCLDRIAARLREVGELTGRDVTRLLG